MSPLRRIGLGALLLLALGLAAVKTAEYRFRLQVLPDGFGAWRIVYAREKVWGFGPGGNESGVVVYAMPRRMSDALDARGLAWLETLAADGDRGRRSRFAHWAPTPVSAEVPWAAPETCRHESAPEGACPGIAVFLNRYGFGLPLRASVEQAVNDALFGPGAYWSTGRGGLLIVIPETRRIVFAYAG